MSTILEVEKILKVYPDGVIANRDVSLEVENNTIHAVVGENGAGKSTLMKIIFGITSPQEGTIRFHGKEVHFKSPNDAIKNGIGMVHQHLMLASDLTVAENMVLGIEPRKRRLFLDQEETLKISKKVSEEHGLDVPVEKKIRDLPIGVRQRVEILKALFRNAELLILDEPTAVLTPQEVEILFKTLFKLKKNGKTILFISHKLKEVKQIADRVTVMRDSRVITTRDAAELTEEKISHLMVGRDIRTDRITPPEAVGRVRLAVRDLSYISDENIRALDHINFDLREGEILGLAGVEGNGQSELIRALTGLLEPTSGEIYLDDKKITGMPPRGIRELGIAHIPEDRMDDGVAERTSLEENFIIDRYYKTPLSKNLRLRWKDIASYSMDLVKQFKILTKSPKTPVGSLSGGNIQKVVVARELSSDPDVIVAAQPTRGVDVGSEEHIHNILKSARDRGKAVFLVSADLDEILKLSTRIIVIYNGEIVAHFSDVSTVTDKDLGPYMLGVKKEEGARGEVHT